MLQILTVIRHNSSFVSLSGHSRDHAMVVIIRPTVYLLAGLIAVLSTDGATRAEDAGSLPLHQKIDRLVHAAAGDADISPLTDDYEFIRRITLDLTGTIPSSETVKKFVADQNPDKRAAAVDALLSSTAWPRRMADLFHVILMERRGDDPAWQRWLERSFEANRPWNELVYQILNADADDEENRAAAYFMSKRLEKYGQNPVDYPGLVRDIGRMFLGQDLQCAECHDHLFIDDYKQLDFQGLFAVYQNTFVRRDVKFPAIGEKAMTAPLEFVSVFDPTQRRTGPRIPGGQSFEIPEPMPADSSASKAPKKKQPDPPRPEWSAVELLAREFTRLENRQFARTTVNRIWYALLGRGLVHPVDLDHSGNPPSHPELLDLLTDEFIVRGFDLKWLIREIVLSRTWQRTSRTVAGSMPSKPEQFVTAIERPLMAEQLLASVIQATGNAETMNAVAAQADKKSESSAESGSAEADIGEDLKLPTRSELESAFAAAFANEAREPEGDFKATVKGALFWRNSEEVQLLLRRRPGNLIDRLYSIEEPSSLIEELYLSVLSRKPSEQEASILRAFIDVQNADREIALRDAAWALITSVEFSVNH